ncbi:MAG TPA: ABC transporter ATP-binding protein [Desulfobacteria bacterium]|nr:ABC transporter ATP-binding protein [Desulfobacteria bacterium]
MKRAKPDYLEADVSVTQNKDILLAVHDLCVSYGEAQALNHVSLFIKKGQSVAVLGSNGAGKTTLLKTVTGMLRPREGNIIFAGEKIEGMPPSEIIRSGVTSVPEGGELFGAMSVSDNLLLGTYSLLPSERKEKLTARLESTFETFPILKSRFNQKAETLSGGERQMLAVARALMSDPGLMALDEPSLGLSPLLVTEMMGLLKNICGTRGVSILLVEQNAKAALKIADYAYVLERGEVSFQGNGREVISNQSIYSAYLGA